MADIGKVRVSQTSPVEGIKLAQTQRTKIVAQNFEPTLNVELSQIGDIDTTGLSNNHTLVYNSATDKWEAKEIDAAGIDIQNITGGGF